MGISLPEAFKLKSGSFMFLRKVLDWGARSYNPKEFQDTVLYIHYVIYTLYHIYTILYIHYII